MNKHSIILRQALLAAILLFLVAPFFQSRFGLIELPPLKGAISSPENSYINHHDWFSNSYQEKEESYLNETFGFRSLFIRINNQIAFSLFRKAKANGVIIGRNNYLFEENYIKAWYGTDFIGYDSIKGRMERLKFIKDSLAGLNKNILLVFAAGKGTFFPEYIPGKYHTQKATTNYEAHIELAASYGIPFIDFNVWFSENKDKSAYPLYPQYGIHWSHYGMVLAADSILAHLGQMRNADISRITIESIEMAQPRGEDYDIADGMNILLRLRSFDMAYPEIGFESTSGTEKPSVLVVADSYYWGMFNLGISKAFNKSHFWFYNKEIYPESFQSPMETSQVDLSEELALHDVFVIMATEANLPGFGWGFVEDLYDHFRGIKRKTTSDPELQVRVMNAINYIRTDPDWMRQIEKKARQKNISVDSMLILDALWVLQNESSK